MGYQFDLGVQNRIFLYQCLKCLDYSTETPLDEECVVGTVTLPIIWPVTISIATALVNVTPTSIPTLILLFSKIVRQA